MLADHAIARHYPEAAGGSNPYRAFLDGVIARQADLVAQVAAGRLHPWGDEHRQLLDCGRNDRLWSVRVHGCL